MILYKIFAIILLSAFFIACEMEDASVFNDNTPQNSNIVSQGIVKDYLTNDALADVNIQIQDVNSTQSDMNGSYQINLISNTEYTLNYTKPNYSSILYNVKTTFDGIQNLETVYMVPLSSGAAGSASGIITSSATSQPLENVNISLRQGISNFNGSVVETTLSTNSGNYNFNNLRADTYTIQMSLENYITEYDTLHVVGGETGSGQNFSMSSMLQNADGNSTLYGVIRSAPTGMNLNDVHLELRQGFNTQTGSVISETSTENNGTIDGTYRFSNIPEGNYTLELSLEDYDTGYANAIVSSQENISQDFLLFTEIEDGNNTLSGTVQSATTGDGLNDVTVHLRQGIDTHAGTIIYSTLTENNGTTDGAYTFNNLPEGNFTTEMLYDGYIIGYGNVEVLESNNGNYNNNFVISPELEEGQLMRIVLTWGETPLDLDSYLLITKDDNTTDKIYFNNKEIIDYGILDVDDLHSYGPETITITHFSSGKYIYYVDRYSSGDLNASNASIQIFKPGEATQVIDINPVGTNKYWEVLHINNGVVDIINTIGSKPSLP